MNFLKQNFHFSFIVYYRAKNIESNVLFTQPPFKKEVLKQIVYSK